LKEKVVAEGFARSKVDVEFFDNADKLGRNQDWKDPKTASDPCRHRANPLERKSGMPSRATQRDKAGGLRLDRHVEAIPTLLAKLGRPTRNGPGRLG
jgi:hypothetical protein